jgi:LmbE family N-acetylglucosaminyl deacetylase
MSGPISHASELPAWTSVLAVVAHPDDESFALGAVIDAFRQHRAAVTVLCFTQGEASTLHGVPGPLSNVRAAELRRAGKALGVGEALLRTHPDGELTAAHGADLVDDVVAVARRVDAQGLLAFDESGVTGHPDHAAATRAGLGAADRLDLPLLTWTLPRSVTDTLNAEKGTAFTGHLLDEVDLVVHVTRYRQRLAVAEHASQALPTSVMWRRLELLGDREYPRWARRPQTTAVPQSGRAAPAAAGTSMSTDTVPVGI